MRSIRYIVRLIQAFFSKFKLIIFFSIFIGAVFFLILSLILPDFLSRKIEKIGISGKYTTETLPEEILTLISGGLTKVNKNGIVEPDIASSWETTDGGKTWIFTINENVIWQDGDLINSDDINYNFSDAEINVIDKRTIEYKLQTPFSAFPVVVSKPIFKKGLLGTGEWEVKKISLVGGYINKLVLQNEKKDKKIFKFYPTEDTLRIGFKLGEIDIIQNLEDSKNFNAWKTVDLKKNVSNHHFVAIFLNTKDQFLAEKTVRQALNYAIDKDIYGDSKAISSISPDSWGYNPLVKPYNLDIEKAKDLLDSGDEIPITLTTSSTLLPVAEKIKKDWEKIGIKTEIQVMAGVPQEYQAFLATVDIPKDPDQYVLWHSTQESTNISHYQNPRIDKLLEDGRTELDLEERKKIYLDFQRFLSEDSPAIFLYHPTFYDVVRK